MHWHYEYAGLRVSSEIEIPEWAGFARAADGGEPDVLIFLQAACAVPPLPVLTRDEHVFFMPAVGAYRVRGGCEISVTPHPETGARELRLFLLGSAWGTLCYQRAILLLHASVVQRDGEAIGFCGPSHAGKSSLAAALVAQGFSLISDDLCRVDFAADGMVLAYPSAPRLKLWEDALENFQKNSTELERDHFRLNKFHVPLREPIPSAPVPLRALYVLGWGELSIARVRGARALQQLVRAATYRSYLLEPMSIVAEHWTRMAELARRVPIFILTRPKTWQAMPDTLGILTRE